MVSAKPGSQLAIIVGGFVSALDLVRSLAALDCRLIVITTQPYDMAQHSRYVSEHHHLENLDTNPERLVILLERHATEWNGALVLPTGDAAVAGLAAYHDRLAPRFHLAIPPLECVPYLLDRNRMLDAARQAGLTLPKYHGTVSELARQGVPPDYPVVVKPARAGEFVARFGRKLFLARDLDAYLSVTRQLAQEKVEGQVFDLIPGPDRAIYAVCVYVDRYGTPVAECTIRKLRQSPPGFGVARVAEISERIALLSEQSIELLRHIGFRGFAAIEFKRDERDGSFRFIEVNGRPVIYGSLLRKGGMDVARLLKADHAGEEMKPPEINHWPGVWIHLHADLLRSLQNWRREQLTLREYLGPYRRRKVFPVWSSSDPKPFRAQWGRTLRQAGSMLVPRPGRNDKSTVRH